MDATTLGLTFRAEETAPIDRAKRAIALKLRALPGLFAIASSEEERVLRFLGELTRSEAIPMRRVVTWSVTEGFTERGVPFEAWGKPNATAQTKALQRVAADLALADAFGVDTGGAPPAMADPVTALARLLGAARLMGPAASGTELGKPDLCALFVLRDLGAAALERPEVQRMLREIRYQLSFTQSAVILLSPQWELPDSVRADISVERFPLPTPPELVDMVLEVLGRLPGAVVGDLAGRGQLVQAIAESCRGMTMEVARHAVEVALLDQGGLTEGVVARVQQERRQIVGQSQALVIEEAALTFADVRDLECLEEYVASRRLGFGAEARAYGLDAPKGVLLVGVPGGGKSAAAQAVARAWDLMLVRLNVGALFGGLVGQSESNLRRALEILDSLGPLLLWVDEIDKGFAMEGGGDSGTSLRVLQELLTWLQHRPGGTVCYFTANDISKIRPELLRKGRVDEIFFADLPGAAARADILGVHLRRRGHGDGTLDLAAVAAATEGFVGAELEQVVVEALYRARARVVGGGAGLQQADLLAAARETVPLVRTYGEKIAAIRGWVEAGRARRASRQPPVPLDRTQDATTAVEAIAARMMTLDGRMA